MEDSKDGLPQLHIITICIDPITNGPEIDLGDVPPHAAICFFHQAALALEELLAPPRISYDGNVIYQIGVEGED